MLGFVSHCRTIAVRCLHTTSCCSQVKNHYPKKFTSIKDTAIKLGFDKATDMYPEYPLDEPPKLWMITQVHTLFGRPYWEKETMKELGLHREHDICVQVNAPFMNEMLWSVKHLIKIQPVRFPQGIPDEDDVGSSQLRPNGEFVIFKKIKVEPVEDKDMIPRAAEEDWKVVDGYRMCRGCKARRCMKYGMCQKLWLQRGLNNLEQLGPRLFNYVENPLKKGKQEDILPSTDEVTDEWTELTEEHR